MEPWMSWAAAAGLGIAGYAYYSRPKGSAAKQQGKDSRPKDSAARRRDSTQDAPRPDSQKPKKRKQPKEQPKDTKTTAIETPVAAAARDDEPEEDDKQWVQQLQAAKEGISMTASKAANAVGATKSNKQNKAENKQGESSKGPASRDVSDMLEPAQPGPSSLRITGEGKPKKVVQKKEQEPEKNKKQRQNQRKNEERKAAAAEDEKERKVLEEKQRRTAREARGEPARNGLGVAQAPANNAWKASGPTTNGASAPTSQPAALLDTFDQDAKSTASSNDVAGNARSPAAASMSSQNLPSEEEQMEAIREMNGWAEVKGKKGKKKASATSSPPAEPGVSEVTNSNISQASQLANGTAHKAAAVPNKAAPATNGYSSLASTKPVAPTSNPLASKAPAMKAHPDDSDWAVE